MERTLTIFRANTVNRTSSGKYWSKVNNVILEIPLNLIDVWDIQVWGFPSAAFLSPAHGRGWLMGNVLRGGLCMKVNWCN